MTNRAPLILTAIGCLLLGIGIGWALKPTGVQEVQAVDSVKPMIAAKPGIENQFASTHDHAPEASVPDSATSAVSDRIRRKREMLESYREPGRIIHFAFSPFGGDRVRPEFAILMDLTPEEKQDMEEVLATAKRAYLEAEVRNGVVTLGSDGSSLTMAVPPMPQEGGDIYDQALAAVAGILGPERFELFNMAARDGFDRSLDSFGLNHVTYRMKPSKQTMANGEQLYDIVREFQGPDGSSRGNSGSVLRLQDLEWAFPQLAKVLPKDFGKNTAK